MNSKSNILVLLTPGFAASEEDSTCLPLQQALVRAWRRVAPHVEIRVVALHYPFLQGQYELFGATVHAFGGRNRGGLSRWQRALQVRRTLDSIHAGGTIAGIISCWYGEAAALGNAFARRRGLAHYCWMLGQDARLSNPWPARLRLPASGLVALSESVQEQFARDHGVCPARIISPGVEAPASSAPASRECLLLGVGSLIALKRWPVFLQVAAALLPSFPGLKVLLLGTGPEQKALEERATRLGLKDVLTFTGTLCHAEVVRTMQRARLLLHPSEYEGYSGVCQEALSVGTPVVSFHAPQWALPNAWKKVASLDEMITAVHSCLANPEGVPPVPFPIEDCARKWITLFSLHSLANTSSSPEAMAVAENFSSNR